MSSMQSKKRDGLRKLVDVCMLILLLCLMSYQVTGEEKHEWTGILMTLTVIVHQILNRRWYATLFRGRYNAYRRLTTLVNLLLLGSMLVTAFCGMSMSEYAVPFLYRAKDLIVVRPTHLAMSHWSFVLMGLHLGLHLPAMTAKVKPGRRGKIALTCAFTCAAGVGLGLFLRNGIPDYLFFRTPFAFFDYDKTGAVVFLENLAELFFFAFAGANAVRLIRSPGGKKERKASPFIPVLCVVLAILIGIGMMLLQSGG